MTTWPITTSLGEVRHSYAEYLRSRHWRRMRVHVFDTGYHNGVEWIVPCARCDDELDGKHMEVHHKTYDRIGHEALCDLLPLCQECHAATHGIAKGESA